MQEQKTLTSIYINKKLLETAKELGLNISKICEHALKLYIQAIKQADQQILNKNSKGGIGTEGSDWCGRRDLNPGPQRGRLTS